MNRTGKQKSEEYKDALKRAKELKETLKTTKEIGKDTMLYYNSGVEKLVSVTPGRLRTVFGLGYAGKEYKYSGGKSKKHKNIKKRKYTKKRRPTKKRRSTKRRRHTKRRRPIKRRR